MLEHKSLESTKGENKEITLTQREREVARALLKHFDEKMVARELGITKRAVGYHSENIRKKLGEKKTASALIKAEKYGLI